MAFRFDQPGIYRIQVAGELDPGWSDRLGGLTIAKAEPAGVEAMPVTALTGWLPDQAALCGVLNALYDRRYALLNVEYLGPG